MLDVLMVQGMGYGMHELATGAAHTQLTNACICRFPLHLCPLYPFDKQIS